MSKGIIPKSKKLAELAKNVQKAAEEYAALAGLHSLHGIEPELGSVLQFEHTFVNNGVCSKPYLYAAIRTEAGWYLSGIRTTGWSGRALSWDNLIEFIGDEECAIATAWAPLGGSAE